MEFGKFNSLEDLVKGYNALEQAFTQKCQQVKELQNNINNNSAATSPETGTNEAAPNNGGTNGNASPNGQNYAATAAENVCDGTNADTSPTAYGAQSATIGTVPDKGATAPEVDNRTQDKSTELLSQLRQILTDNPELLAGLTPKQSIAPPSVISGGGNVSMALPSRPKTLKEASEMAQKLFE